MSKAFCVQCLLTVFEDKEDFGSRHLPVQGSTTLIFVWKDVFQNKTTLTFGKCNSFYFYFISEFKCIVEPLTPDIKLAQCEH